VEDKLMSTALARRNQRRARSPAHQEGPLKVAVEHAVPRLLGVVEDLPANCQPGVVDEDVQPPESRHRRINGRSARGCVGDVQLALQRAPTEAADRGRGGDGGHGLAAGHHYVRARPRQPDRDALADALARAGHQRDPALEVEQAGQELGIRHLGAVYSLETRPRSGHSEHR